MYKWQERANYDGAKAKLETPFLVIKKEDTQKDTQKDTIKKDTQKEAYTQAIINLGYKIKIFFMAPIVNYFYHLIAYLLFLILLSYVALFHLTSGVLETPEIVLCVWVGGLLCEEFLEVS